MEITELMIGDIVQYLDGKKLITVVVVKIDGSGNVVRLKQKNGHKFNTTIDFLRPIPLTPEILERNGFRIEEEYDEIYDTHNYYATLSCVDSEKRNVEVNYSTFGNEITIFCYDRRNVLLYRSLETQIKYVHQLQHAFALCKINKQIALP